MLYYILYSLHLKFSLFNVFRYITFRTVLSLLTALVISFILTPFIIRKFREWKIKSGKREDVRKDMKKKKKRPRWAAL
jgi:phospho-N-acetylmuramoyl-pentapeptide-transferase